MKNATKEMKNAVLESLKILFWGEKVKFNSRSPVLLMSEVNSKATQVQV